MQENISLFTTFFLPESIERRKELLFCLNQNINNKFIKNIFLLLDGKNNEQTKEYITTTVTPLNKITFIDNKRVPTYGDWIFYSKQYSQELADISVFINADIFLDETVDNIKDFTKETESLVCLTRHEMNLESREVTPHPNPHWSQDLWAISKENILNLNNLYFIDELNITHTGIYRCDNKFAYLFAMRGWKIFNPYSHVKCYHIQNDVLRTYGKIDANIVGGLCFPAVTDSPNVPSELDISVMPVKVGKITKCAINRYLQKNLYPELEPTSTVIEPPAVQGEIKKK